MLIRSAFIIVAVTMVGRLLGFIRGIFISQEFGVGAETDAFFMAFVIPMTLLMILPGAINSVFIPALNRARTLEEGSERVLFEKVFTITFLAGVLATALMYLLSSPLVSVLAPGFDPVKKELTLELLKWMLPSVVLIALTGVFSSVLNVHHQFFYPSLGTVINSSLVIASIFLLVPFMGIHGLALGTSLGFAGYALIMVPSLLKKKYRFRIRREWRGDPVLTGMGERFVPVMIGSLVSQLALFIERILASGLGDARVASLALAYTVMQLPMAVFVGAFTVPLFPLLSEHAQHKRYDQMKKLLEKGVAYLVLIMIPIMAGLIMLSEDIIRLLYERGEFDAEDTQLTAWALMFYSLAILGLALRETLTRAFYALEDTKTPVLTGLAGIVFYVGISLLLMPQLDHGGIALSFSLAAYLSSFLLAFILRKKTGRVLSGHFWLTLVKTLAASAVMALVLGWIHGFPGEYQDAGWMAGWPSVIKVSLLIVLGALVYGGVLLILKEKLLWEMIGRLFHRITGKKEKDVS